MQLRNITIVAAGLVLATPAIAQQGMVVPGSPPQIPTATPAPPPSPQTIIDALATKARGIEEMLDRALLQLAQEREKVTQEQLRAAAVLARREVELDRRLKYVLDEWVPKAASPSPPEPAKP